MGQQKGNRTADKIRCLIFDNQIRELVPDSIFPELPHFVQGNRTFEIRVQRIIEGTLNGVVRALHQAAIHGRRSSRKATVGVLTAEEFA